MKKSSIVKFCVAQAILVIALVFGWFLYQGYQHETEVEYIPFATKADSLGLNEISIAEVMEGTPENDLLISSPKGSKIFAKAGLNYIIANEGADELYFSLCSTKIIDGQVSVVEGFDPKKDKLYIYCGHHEISPKDIKIIHGNFEEQPVTYVQIEGEHSVSAIALLGDIDINIKDIILNKRWEAAKDKK